MLPVVVSPRRAVSWMLAHVAATGALGLLLATQDGLGLLYLVPVLLMTVWMAREAAHLLTDYTGSRALSVFKVSNIFLSVVLIAVCFATLV
jgi:heme O synthase-like polyprenyltransferase